MTDRPIALSLRPAVVPRRWRKSTTFLWNYGPTKWR